MDRRCCHCRRHRKSDDRGGGRRRGNLVVVTTILMMLCLTTPGVVMGESSSLSSSSSSSSSRSTTITATTNNHTSLSKDDSSMILFEELLGGGSNTVRRRRSNSQQQNYYHNPTIISNRPVSSRLEDQVSRYSTLSPRGFAATTTETNNNNGSSRKRSSSTLQTTPFLPGILGLDNADNNKQDDRLFLENSSSSSFTDADDDESEATGNNDKIHKQQDKYAQTQRVNNSNDHYDNGAQNKHHFRPLRQRFRNSIRKLLQLGSFDIRDDDDHSSGAEKNLEDGTQPLAYRYYSRKRVRPPKAGSIPIVLFGPNADHWKVVGQHLQQNGFSVIACERVTTQQQQRQQQSAPDNHEVNSQLVKNLLDALRWKNALLVACDDESLTVIQATLSLQPDRVAGLILCGNLLSSTTKFSSSDPRWPGIFGLDGFLKENLHCPFTIVWDGDTSEADEALLVAVGGGESSTTSSDANNNALDTSVLHRYRSLILGGGLAPHRRRPEQLSWVITRFVEEKVAPKANKNSGQVKSPPSHSFYINQGGTEKDTDASDSSTSGGFLSTLFSQESMVVLGRILATAIAYGTILKVGFYQYDSFRSGIFDFQTRLHDFLGAPEKIAAAVVGVFRGLIPRILGMFAGGRNSDEETSVLPIEDGDEVSSPEIVTNDADDGSSDAELDTDCPMADSDTDSQNLNQTDTNEDETFEDEGEDERLGDEHLFYGTPRFYLDSVVV